MSDARAAYSRSDFEAFFGLAQWARLTLPAGLSAADRDHLLALELMGLARHCRWSDIALLKEEASGPLSIKAYELIAVKAEYRRFASDPKYKSPSLERKITHAREHWALTPDKMRSFGSPAALRAKVRSLCEPS